MGRKKKIEDKKKSVKRSVDLSEDTLEALQKIAASKNIYVSELIRIYIEKGLNVDKTKEDIDFIRLQIREELQLQLRPNTDRIMKVLMRIGMMCVSGTFFASKIIYYFAPVSEKKSHAELLNEARKEAAAFLGMKDESLDRAFDDFKK